MTFVLVVMAALLLLYAANGLLAGLLRRHGVARPYGGGVGRVITAGLGLPKHAINDRPAWGEQVGARTADAAQGILSALTVLLGVLLMQRTGTAPLFSGLPAGLLSDVFPNPGWIIAGSILIVLGCIGVFRWLPAYRFWEWEADASQFTRRAMPDPAPARRLAHRAIIPALAGGVLYAVVLLHAHSSEAGALVILCFIAAVALLGVALHRIVRDEGSATWRTSFGLTRLDGLVITAVIIAFIAVNAHDLRSWVFAYIGDEWPFYALAKAIATGASFDPLSQMGVYGYHPVADSVYQGLVMRFFGLNVVGWKLSCVLATALAVIPLYWLAKRMGGALIATTAAIIYAACPLLWAYSHIGYNEEDPLPLMVLAAALCFAALRDRRPVLLYAAGAVAGAGWYTLFTGRLMIGVLVLFVLTDWRGGWPALGRRMAVLLGGFALVALPLFVDNGAATIRQMLPLASLTPGSRATMPASVLLQQNTVRGLYAFLYNTVDDHYTAGALFDVVSAAALCIGVTLALRRLRSLPARLLLIWFGLTTALTTPLYYVPQVATTRAMIIVPPAALLAALGLCSVGGAVGAALGRQRRLLVSSTSVAGALCVIILLNGFHDYDYVTLPSHYWPPYPVVVSTVQAITTLPRSTFILPADMPTQNVNGDLCVILDGFQVDPSTVLRFYGRQPVPYCPSSLSNPPRTLTPSSQLVLLVDTTATMLRCVVPPSVSYVQNQATVWAYRVGVPPRPAGGYAAWVARRAVQTCPTLAV